MLIVPEFIPHADKSQMLATPSEVLLKSTGCWLSYTDSMLTFECHLILIKKARECIPLHIELHL